MFRRLAFTLSQLGLALFIGEASAQSKEPFPHARDWVDSDYGHSDPWFSATLGVNHRQTPETIWVPPINIVVYDLEGRLHFNPRLAIVSGIQWGGYNKLALEGEVGPGSEVSNDIYQDFNTFVFSVGADIGLFEHKYLHLQAGPRLGLRTQSTALVGDDKEIDQLNDIKSSSTMFHLGGTASVGAFVVPFVEVGLRLQADYGLGGDAAGAGYQVGGYTTTHF